MTGAHSMIERPDSVSRVMAPISTIATIMPHTANSQQAIGRRSSSGVIGTRGVSGEARAMVAGF